MSFEVQISDPTAPRADFDIAQQAMFRASLHDKVDETITSEYEAARQALKDCFVTIKLTALASDDLESLIALHPPTLADEKDASWCEETFLPALLAECAEGGMSPAEWAETLTSWSTGERAALRLTVLRLNLEHEGSGVPLG